MHNLLPKKLLEMIKGIKVDNKKLLIGIIPVTLLLGALIGSNIMHTKWTKELIQQSLEKGQNPMYVKCAMEITSSNECKTLITAIAVSKSDK